MIDVKNIKASDRCVIIEVARKLNKKPFDVTYDDMKLVMFTAEDLKYVYEDAVRTTRDVYSENYATANMEIKEKIY